VTKVEGKYRLKLLDLTKDNKILKNFKPEDVLDLESSMAIENQSKIIEVFEENTLSTVEVQPFSQIINSEFGDMVLIIYPTEIHELEIIDNVKVRTKNIGITKYLN